MTGFKRFRAIAAAIMRMLGASPAAVAPTPATRVLRASFDRHRAAASTSDPVVDRSAQSDRRCANAEPVEPGYDVGAAIARAVIADAEIGALARPASQLQAKQHRKDHRRLIARLGGVVP